MYEGTPDYPDRDRLWEIVDRNAVDVFYHRADGDSCVHEVGLGLPHAPRPLVAAPARHGRRADQPRPWNWYREHIGGGDCPVVDTWWQTETGAVTISTLPGIDEMKPGSAGPPLPGIDARVVDAQGEQVAPGEAGYLTIERPWPGMARTLYDNDERFVAEYWRRFSDPETDDWRYFSGDTARADDDGYITVLGRVDDVITVSGHRLGTMEIGARSPMSTASPKPPSSAARARPRTPRSTRTSAPRAATSPTRRFGGRSSRASNPRSARSPTPRS